MNPQNPTLDAARSIGDAFVSWQDDRGGIDRARCPYLAPKYHPLFRDMEIPFMARALSGLSAATRNAAYLEASGRYADYYLDLVENLATSERIAYKFGIAMESAALVARDHPGRCLEVAARGLTVLKWLRQLRTDLGSWFLCGYKPGLASLKDKPDVGFSDDLCHVGRGLVRLYEATRRPDILADIRGLCGYYLRDVAPDSMQGLWSRDLGTWVIGPWPDTAFEHMDNTPACAAGWVWSAYGGADFLLAALPYLEDGPERDLVRDRVMASNRWIFRECQFEDGAIGMTGRDDRWVGLTAAAILVVLGTEKAGLMTEQERKEFGPPVRAAWSWLLAHVGENLPEAGYLEATGKTFPSPGDNVAWLLSWTCECLLRAQDVQAFLR